MKQSLLKQKIDWLKQLGLDVYQSPSYISGKLKARDFGVFVDNMIDYLEKHFHKRFY